MSFSPLTKTKRLTNMPYKNWMAAIALGFISLQAGAQKTEPIFEIRAGNAITNTKFLIQSGTGELITGTDTKLMAIDAVKQNVIWENTQFLGLDEEEIDVLDGTPYIKIERQKTLSLGANKNTYLLQARDGKVVYDSKDEGIKVRHTQVMPQLGGILLEYVKGGQFGVAFVDFGQGKELWSVELGKDKTGFISQAMGRAKGGISAFKTAPIVDAQQNLILVYRTDIVAVSRTGAIAWKKQYSQPVEDAYLSKDGQSVFVGYRIYIDKLNTQTGSSLLKEPIKMRDELNGILPMGDDYIVYNEAGINIMDANGNMKWEKDTKLGKITAVRFNANGILAVQNIKNEETTLFWVNLSGKKIWDNYSKGGFIMAEPTEKGIMYVTTERANVLTYEKGRDVWDKDIKIKGIPNFGIDGANKTVYAYSNEKVHAFNFNDVSYRLLSDKLEFKKFDDEKEAVTLEVRDQGKLLLVYTQQNVAALQTADGKVVYNQFFKEIGYTKKKWMRAAAVGMSIGGAALNVAGQVNITQGLGTALTTGNTSKLETGIHQYNAGSDINMAGNLLYAEASKRYALTIATKDRLYVLSQMSEGNGLLVLDKDHGQTLKQIYFSDITPQYVVDEAADRVYVVIGNVIKAFDLK